MFSFVVFDADGVDARNFPPRHAHLVGTDDVPFQGDVTFEGSLVRCSIAQPQSAGLVLQFQVGKPEIDGQPVPSLPPVGGGGGGNGVAPAGVAGANGGLGLLTIQTCLLPVRKRPYLLSMELARHRIMLFLNKLEDWGLTDLPPETPVMQQFEHARTAFTQALVAQREVTGDGAAAETHGGFSVAADRQSSRAIALAVNAGEGLTLINADRQLKARLSGKAHSEAAAHLARITPETPPAGSPILIPGAGTVVLPGIPQIGAAISPGQFSEPMQRAAQAACDFVVMPMRWIDMEPSEGKYQFAATDRWIEWAIRTAKLPVVAGPLIDFRAHAVPDWLYIWENDYETLRDLVFEHVQAVVTRYRRTVQRWVVASGLHINTNFKISFEQIMDLTRMCVLLVRKLHPTAKIVLEVDQPWGEYHAYNRRSIPPYLYAEAVMQSQLAIDGIGLRVQMGDARPGAATRDLMAISAMMDRFAALEKPLHLSIGAPSATITPTPFRPRVGASAEDAYEPGYWRHQWSEGSQADWMTHVMTIAASKPGVASICWQELADFPAQVDASEMPGGGLLTAAGQPKAGLARLGLLRQCLKEGRSPLAPAARG